MNDDALSPKTRSSSPAPVLAAALFLLALALGGTAEARDRLVLQLKWLPQTQFAGYYVAAAKGFYREQGLQVVIRPGGPNLTPARALAQRKADVAVDWLPSALSAREKGRLLVNIAQIFQRSGMELTCRRDSGVRRPADLKGKTIGVWFAGNQYPFYAFMAKLGIRARGPHPEVHVVREGAGVGLLLDKKADCISTMSYNEYWRLIDAGMKPRDLVVFRYQDEGVATLEDGLYALQTRLGHTRLRERLARFLRASIKGWRYALAHQREAVDIVMKEGGSRLRREDEARMMRDVARLVPDGKHGIGYLEPADYHRTVAILRAGPDPVIREEPRAAWTHEIWKMAVRR